MKKIILSLAIIAAGAFSFNAFADTTDNKPANEKCEAAAACNAKQAPGKECRGKGGHKKGHKHGHKRPDMFKGITLSPEQQTQLNDLRNECRNQRVENQNLSAEKLGKSREDYKKLREESRQKFNARVKEILTPEQFVVYEQNVKNFEAKKLEHKDRVGKGKKGKDNKNCTGDKKGKGSRKGKTDKK